MPRLARFLWFLASGQSIGDCNRMRERAGRADPLPKKTDRAICGAVPGKKINGKLLDEKSFSKLIAAHERLHGAKAAEEILNLPVLINLLRGKNRLRR
jgi:hypothetical protein